jgi:uncharacterized protein
MLCRVWFYVCLCAALSLSLDKSLAQAPANQQSAQPAETPFQRAAAAKKKGDYLTVMREFMPFAERGNIEAQAIVGSIYGDGEGGVVRSPTEAVKWNRRAAQQGHKSGQSYLGVMYGLGRGGLPEDRVAAHMWLSLAAAQGDAVAAKSRDKIAEFLKPAELAEAKKRADEWKPVKENIAPADLPLFGFGQISRSDGLKTFFVTGTHPTKAQCERLTNIFVTSQANTAKAAGHTATLESLACETSVPRDTDYEALRYGTPGAHYMLFSADLRLMSKNERATPDYERALCEQMRNALKPHVPDMSCQAPKSPR